MGIFDFFKKKKTTKEIDNIDLEDKIFTVETQESSNIKDEFIPIDTGVKDKVIGIEKIPIEEEIQEDFDMLDELGVYNPRLDLSHYEFPSLSLLNKIESNISPEQIIDSSRLIEILESFGIRTKSITKNLGAIITVFEIILEPGVKIATLRRLDEDIAIALSTPGVSIIPIPERGTIGIVVPICLLSSRIYRCI